MRFGLLRFRSPLLTESLLISFPRLLRWFTSSRMAPPHYFIHVTRCRNRSLRVTPFGYPRITGYVLLPAAFRSLSRPSSPPGSKASAVDLYSLDHITSSPSPSLADPAHSSIARNPRSERRLFIFNLLLTFSFPCSCQITSLYKRGKRWDRIELNY